MGKSLRENFERLLAELPSFRQDLGKVVQAAVEEEPALKESLGELLKGFDASIAEAKQEMPGALAGLEKEMAGLQPGIDELRQSITEAEQSLAAMPVAGAAAAAVFVPLPRGHGQMLRGELLERFAPPPAPARAVLAAGNVHDLTSGDWKDATAAREPVKPPHPKPRTDIQPPRKEPPSRKEPPPHDVGDMNSQDWR